MGREVKDARQEERTSMFGRKSGNINNEHDNGRRPRYRRDLSSLKVELKETHKYSLLVCFFFLSATFSSIELPIFSLRASCVFCFVFFFRRQVKNAMGAEKRRSKVRSLGDKQPVTGLDRERELYNEG